MVTRIGSSRRKARKKLTKPLSEKGKVSIRKYFGKFNEGDAVVLKAEPAVQKGMYHLRFHGKRGIIGKKQGDCYNVTIKDCSASKTLIVHPVHLKRL